MRGAIAPLDHAVLVPTSGNDTFSLDGRSHRTDCNGNNRQRSGFVTHSVTQYDFSKMTGSATMTDSCHFTALLD